MLVISHKISGWWFELKHMSHRPLLMNTCRSIAASFPFATAPLRLKVASLMALRIRRDDRVICLKGKGHWLQPHESKGAAEHMVVSSHWLDM